MRGKTAPVLFLLLLAFLAAVCNARGHRHPSVNRDHDPEENMTTPEIIAYWGYPVQSVQAITKDNYILTMHRIPHGKKTAAATNKGVIFMQHGLFGSSSNWITNLPNLAFGEKLRVFSEDGAGYIAADAGYDVWLGNKRARQ